MATLNIKDPEVYGLARRLGSSMTGAVRVALLDAVERERRIRYDYVEPMSQLARPARDASQEPILDDDDLGDHRGLPR